MSWLILICSMQLISSGYFSGAEDCNYSPVKVSVALTSLITAEKKGVERTGRQMLSQYVICE